MDTESTSPETPPTPDNASRKTAASIVHARSCLSCHRRKVRCDRRSPCANCIRHKVPCIFPFADLARRSGSVGGGGGGVGVGAAGGNDDLIAIRLRKLESIVEELRGQVPEGRGQGGANRRFEQPYARLLLDETGRAKYLHSAFWMHINAELEQYIDSDWFLDTTTKDKDRNNTTTKDAESLGLFTPAIGLESTHTFIHRPLDSVNLRNFHPLPSQIPYFWQVYKSNVDPMAKLFHIPTMERVMDAVHADLNNLPAPIEVLLFTVYYGAITSMQSADVLRDMGMEKMALLRRYRFAIEQALAKAQFLNEPELLTLQSFLLFLLFLRKNGDVRYSAMMIALAVRISQSLGLHRDGSQLSNLSPYRAEMQRRLFWGLVVVDRRSSEDLGMDAMIAEGTYDTAVPLNINDADLSPHATFLPPERKGLTEMTCTLIRIKTMLTSIKVHQMISEVSKTLLTKESIDKLEQRCEDEWKSCRAYIHEHYIGDDAPEAMKWICNGMAALTVAKLRLMAQCSLPTPSEDGSLPTFRLPLSWRRIAWLAEMLEFNHVSNQDTRLVHWRWVFVSYARWHGTSLLLMELLRHPWSSVNERGWEAMHNLLRDSDPGELESLAERTIMLVPFQKLYYLVTEHRNSEIARLQADPEAARKLHQEAIHPKNLGLFVVSLEEFAIKADRRWRQLVGLQSETTTHSSPIDLDEKESGYNQLFDVIMGSNKDQLTDDILDGVGSGLEDFSNAYNGETLSEEQIQSLFSFSGM